MSRNTGLLRTKPLDASASVTSTHSGLKRVLGPVELVMLGIGAIVGTGIFVLTGTGALVAGPGLSLSFVIAALACGFAALCYAEFAAMMPISGSIYSYSYVALGELVAWIIGWDLMLEYGLAASTVAVGWSGYFNSMLAGVGLTLPQAFTAAPGAVPGVHTLMNLPALCIMLLLAGLLSIGIRESARVNAALVILKIAVVLLFIAVGIWHVKPANWVPFAPFGATGIFSAAALVFFAFIGFDAVTSAAEEVKRPARDVPIGIIGSLLVCSVLYVVVSTIMTGIVPFQDFAGVDHPISLALQRAGSNWVAGFVDLGAILGMTTVMLVMSFGQTRVIFAMSRDGLLPARLSAVHPRFGTPFMTTWLVGLLFGLIAAFVPLRVLAELVNMGTLAAFALISIAVLVLRHRRPDLPRPFRCPGVPVLPLISCFACVGLMCFLKPLTWAAFGSWAAIGLVVYFSYSRRHSRLAGS